MTFTEVATECIGTPELVKEFNRLTGCKLGIDKRHPIEKMVDKATGYQIELDKQESEDMKKFVKFVFEFIWLPLI